MCKFLVIYNITPFSATGAIRTIFLTLSGLSTATLGGMLVPSLCPINVAFFVAFTSGCCNNTDKAFSASCFRLLNVRLPHALLSDTVFLSAVTWIDDDHGLE